MTATATFIWILDWNHVNPLTPGAQGCAVFEEHWFNSRRACTIFHPVILLCISREASPLFHVYFFSSPCVWKDPERSIHQNVHFYTQSTMWTFDHSEGNINKLYFLLLISSIGKRSRGISTKKRKIAKKPRCTSTSEPCPRSKHKHIKVFYAF